MSALGKSTTQRRKTQWQEAKRRTVMELPEGWPGSGNAVGCGVTGGEEAASSEVGWPAVGVGKESGTEGAPGQSSGRKQPQADAEDGRAVKKVRAVAEAG